MTTAHLGLIAGEGELPKHLLKAATEEGFRVSAIVFSKGAEGELAPLCDSIGRFGIGQAGRMLRFLKEAGVREVAFAGKLDKFLLFRNLKFDLLAVKILLGVRNRSDETLLKAAVRTLEAEGIRVLEQTRFLAHLLTPMGPLSRRRPSRGEMADIAYGLHLARGVAALDIGQTVVVRDGAVLAVEAVEGTDATIRRGCALGKGKAVVVKVSRPHQDFRFDIPVVGENTVRIMGEAGARALGLEAGRTMLIDREAVTGAADKLGIAVWGYLPPEETSPSAGA